MTRLLGLALLAGWLSASPAHGKVIFHPIPDAHKATPEQKAQARKAFERARKAYNDDDLEMALFAAEAAFKYLPNASTALLRAIILGALERHANAFAAYLAASDLNPNDKEKELIEQGLKRHGKEIEPPLGWLIVVAKPLGAQVTIDGKRFEAPRAVGLSAGRHRITVEAEGYIRFEGGFSIVGGHGQRVEYSLNEVPPAVDDGAAVWPWALVASGAALLGTGAALNVWAANRGQDSIDLQSPSPSLSSSQRKAQFDSAQSDADLGQILAYTLYGIGGATVIAGIVILVVGDDDAPAVTPTVGPAPGVSLHGRF